ncbi:MAG: carbon-phosphorus lyase complex subunit PhnI [Roseiflexaceae bacterium]
MGYVAARGGEQAIQQAERFFQQLNGPIDAAFVRAVEQLMPYLVDRVMGEGSLYAPELAALALAQTGGDLYEAVLLLRAYRSTQPRLAYAEPIADASTLTVRRISAAFKDIPGGQILGPTLDYSHRILRTEVLDERPMTKDEGPSTSASGFANQAEDKRPMTKDEGPSTSASEFANQAVFQDATEQLSSSVPRPSSPSSLPPVADWLRLNGLLADLPEQATACPSDLPDVTRDPIRFPAARAHRLQSLARADTGGVLALGYASMRGYGLAHPTVNEVRLGYADVQLRHPISGIIFSAGRMRVSQAEIVSNSADQLELGFAATMGWNEIKTISAAMLDLEMDSPTPHPAHSEEFVLYHTEPVEASGFCIHYKLPHYVTFSSTLDTIRRVQNQNGQADKLTS